MVKDHEAKINDLKDKIKEFCEDRDWDQFHNAKDLAIALSIEASELLELFRWKSGNEVEELFQNEKKREDIEDEMADILYFLVRMAQRHNIDLSEALDKKMEKNNNKYPIEKARGSNKKYTEL
ncbi:MAG: nucleotide pyrophosphohydrolase [Candidatus Nanoarchaeia archaeon]|nr:nucleotide pyrophosphohydrolase [Candidatus Nanoarchaeia archaeon]